MTYSGSEHYVLDNQDEGLQIVGIMLPVTSKLWPAPRNLMYLAEVAVLTRLATGVARVLENRPVKQKDPAMTEGQKKQAMTERFFVEILGTMGYMACLHLGQDLVDKLANRWDRRQELAFLNQKDSLLKGLEQNQDYQAGKATLEKLGATIDDLDKRLKESAEDVFGKFSSEGNARPQNMIFNTLYEHDLPGSPSKGALTGKANLAAVKNRLKAKVLESQPDLLKNPGQLDDALSKIVNEVKPLKDFAIKNNKLAVGGIALGVLASAIVGGTITQWMNDRVISPGAKKFFARKSQKEALKSSGSLAGGVGAQATHKSISLVSPAPALPLGATTSAPMAPVYLPNPKIQASAPVFAARALPPVSRVNPLPWPGGGL